MQKVMFQMIGLTYRVPNTGIMPVPGEVVAPKNMIPETSEMAMELEFNSNEIDADAVDLQPSAEWDVDRLADYAKDRFKIAGFFGRKTAIQLHRAGRAVNFAKKTLKGERRWTIWAQKHQIPIGAAWEVSRIADTFDSEEDLEGLTAFEAKLIAGVVKEKKKPKVDKPEPKTKAVPTPPPVCPAPTVSIITPKEPEPIPAGKTPLGFQSPNALMPPASSAEDLEGEIVEACNLLRRIIKAAGDRGTRVKVSTTSTVRETLEDLGRVLEWVA